jgi:hypothetical protein
MPSFLSISAVDDKWRATDFPRRHQISPGRRRHKLVENWSKGMRPRRTLDEAQPLYLNVTTVASGYGPRVLRVLRNVRATWPTRPTPSPGSAYWISLPDTTRKAASRRRRQDRWSGGYHGRPSPFRGGATHDQRRANRGQVRGLQRHGRRAGKRAEVGPQDLSGPLREVHGKGRIPKSE